MFLNGVILISDHLDTNVDDIGTSSFSDYSLSIKVCGFILLCFTFFVFLDVAMRRLPYHLMKAKV